MADDDRSPDVAAWLEVEPLDDVTRRRLVSNALRESEEDATPESHTPAVARPSRAWRWLAAAAVIVVLLVGALALLSNDGGNDTPTAARDQVREPARNQTPDPSGALAPQSFEQALGAAPNVGDYGDLDDAANLAKLRAALEHPQSSKNAEAAEPASSGATADAGSGQFSTRGCIRGSIGTVVAQGRGTLDGRPVTVVLLEAAGGKQSITALFDDACEFRQLSGSG